MNRRHSLFSAMFVMSLIIGCGGSSREMSQPTKAVSWPAQKALMDLKILMPIGMAIQTKNVAEARTACSSPDVEKAVDDFEKAEVPKAFASPARETAKKAVVDAYKAMISKGKSNGSLKDLEDARNAVSAATAKLTDGNLK